MFDRHAVRKLLDAEVKARAVAEQFRASRRTIERIAREAEVRRLADGRRQREGDATRRSVGRPQVTAATRVRVQALIADDPECPPGEICRLLRAGGHAAWPEHGVIRILVNELVASFEHLRPDQIFVSRQVRLARGDTVRWPVSKGVFWLKYIPARDGDAPPTISLQGDAQCQLANPLQTVIGTEDVIAKLCAVNGRASIELAHGKMGAPLVEGFVMLDRARGSFSTPRKR